MKRLLVALALVVAACTPVSDQTAPGPAATEQASGVPMALAWNAELVGGGQLSGGDLAGGDVVLWFWAPW